MPIRIRDPMECDPQWVDMRTKKPIRKEKKLPPEILKLAEVLAFELRHHLKSGAPPGIFLQAAIAVVRAQQIIVSDAGARNVMKRHGAPGGSHDLADEARKAWASGKYKSREECAEQEHTKIGSSRKAVRNALVNAPKPERRG